MRMNYLSITMAERIPMAFKQGSFFSYKANDVATKNVLFNKSQQKHCKTIEAERRGILDKFRKTRKQFEQRLARHAQDSLSLDEIKALQNYVDDNRDERQFCNSFRTVRKKTLGSAKKPSATYSKKSTQTRKDDSKDPDAMNNNTLVNKIRWLDVKSTVEKDTKVENKNPEIDRNVTTEFTGCEGQTKVKYYRRNLPKDRKTSQSNNDKKKLEQSDLAEQVPDTSELLRITVLSPKKLSPILQESDDGEHLEGLKTIALAQPDNANIFDNAKDYDKKIPQSDQTTDEYQLAVTRENIMTNFGSRRSISWGEGSTLQKKIANAVQNLNKSDQEIPRACQRRQSVADVEPARKKPNRLLRRQSLDVAAFKEWGSNGLCANRLIAGETISFDQNTGETAEFRKQKVVKVYSEEPFYVRRQKPVTRRMSWQSNDLSPETLSKLRAIADQSAAERKRQVVEETPLDDLLPPIKLPSIFLQNTGQKSDREMLQERAQSRRKTSEINHEQLNRNLKDCRYLRMPIRR